MANLLRTIRELAPGHDASYSRVLSSAQWSGLALGCALARFVIDRLVPDGTVDLVGDDTVDGHPGPRVYGKGRHRDAVRSSHSYTAWRYGQKWVVLAVLVKFPFAARRWAFRPPKRTARFTRDMVLRLVGQLGLGCRPPHGSPAGLGSGEYRPAGLARRLGVNRDTVRRWVRVGWVHVRRDADGHHVIWADAGELRRLRELHQLPRTWANKARLAELTKPNPRPAR